MGNTTPGQSCCFVPERALKIGLLGCGTVGSPVAKALLEDRATLERAAGVPLELARVAVRHPRKPRPVELPSDIITTDAVAVAVDPDVDIVVEIMGGIHPALDAVNGALGDNKSVVTANKELLAGAGASLLDDDHEDLSFEAAVCGAVPIVRTLKEYCAADSVHAFTGTFSGTCNFVLSRMTTSGCSLDAAIAEAQQLGYAEADARADILGLDAAAKVAILARVAFGVAATINDIEHEGIFDIDQARVGEARSKGLVYQLVGGARRVSSGFDAWVRPVLLPCTDHLARTEGAENAVLIDAVRAGRLLLQGQGAGGSATAAAVLADLVASARRAGRKTSCL